MVVKFLNPHQNKCQQNPRETNIWPRPTKAKDPKPKAEAGGGSAESALGGFKGIIINAVLTIVLMSIFLGAMYFMMNSMISQLGPQPDGDGHGEEHGHSEVSMSFPYETRRFYH